MEDKDISKVLTALRKAKSKWVTPAVTQVAKDSRDPFRVLISTILSLRTQDTTTAKASARLFKLASTPEQMLTIPLYELEKTIYPVGFYKNKAKTIHGICEELINRYGSEVPEDLDKLVELKGVGRKTANLVITLGFDKYGICVDTHVHRISNRLGYVKTTSPDKTEMALREKLPKRHWKEINDLLVAFGQNLCRPLSPMCSVCPVEEWCDRVGVTKSR